jgi:hypothetical protein
MRVSAAPFAGHASGGPPAAAHIRDVEPRGGYLGYAAKADDLQLKSEGRDFVYVDADYAAESQSQAVPAYRRPLRQTRSRLPRLHQAGSIRIWLRSYQSKL